MFFQYLGDKPLRVEIPKEQYVMDVYPSPNGQKTTHEGFYNYIFSDACPETHLFKRVDGFHIPQEQPPVAEVESHPEEPSKKRRVKETD